MSPAFAGFNHKRFYPRLSSAFTDVAQSLLGVSEQFYGGSEIPRVAAIVGFRGGQAFPLCHGRSTIFAHC